MSEGGKRMAIFGKSGSGKSHHAKKLVADLDRVVAFDPEEEYGELPGFMEVTSLKVLRDTLEDCWDGSFKLAYVPKDLQEEVELHRVSLLIERLGEAFRIGKHDKKSTLVVDELNLSFPLNPKPACQGFARLCSKGRKRGINLIGITQRPAEVATRFRGNLDRIDCFRLSLPNDWAVVRETMGPDAELMVKKLPQYGRIEWTGDRPKEVLPS